MYSIVQTQTKLGLRELFTRNQQFFLTLGWSVCKLRIPMTAGGRVCPNTPPPLEILHSKNYQKSPYPPWYTKIISRVSLRKIFGPAQEQIKYASLPI